MLCRSSPSPTMEEVDSIPSSWTAVPCMSPGPDTLRAARTGETVAGRKSYGELLRRIARTEPDPPEYRGEPVQVIPLVAAPLSFGTESGCEVLLRDDLVAGRHA